MIDAGERKVLLAISILAVIWIIFVIPFTTSSPSFVSLNNVYAYFIFNLGFILLSVVIFGTIMATFKDKFSYWNAIMDGLASWFSYSFVLDNWSPPYFIDIHGNQVIQSVGTGVNASVDAMLTYVVNYLFPSFQGITVPLINISWLYIAVYLIIPFLTVIIAAMVLTRGQFFRWVGHGGEKNARKM